MFHRTAFLKVVGCWLLVVGCWLVCSYYNAGARYCLPDSRTTRLYKSRDFVPGYSRCARYCLPDRFVVLSFSCIVVLLFVGRFGWKPIPRAASVTRDEVSGVKTSIEELSGRQYQSTRQQDNQTTTNYKEI